MRENVRPLSLCPEVSQAEPPALSRRGTFAARARSGPTRLAGVAGRRPRGWTRQPGGQTSGRRRPAGQLSVWRGLRCAQRDRGARWGAALESEPRSVGPGEKRRVRSAACVCEAGPARPKAGSTSAETSPDTTAGRIFSRPAPFVTFSGLPGSIVDQGTGIYRNA